MKRMILGFCAAALLLALSLNVYAIDIPPGPVTGTWTATNNPYNILGEINVPSGQSLLIEHGVQVVFQGHYKFIVNTNATLQAVGSEEDSIEFRAANPDTGWWGIRLLSASDSCRFEYCLFTDGKATGGISLNGLGGAMLCESTDASIGFCTFTNNSSNYSGGALSIHGNSHAAIHNSVIINNSTAGLSAAGGGIDLSTPAYLSLENSLLASNTTTGWGGAIAASGHGKLVNCTITNNTSGQGAAVALSLLDTLKNCVVYFNSPSQLSPVNVIVTFSDIQGGFTGTGNINQDPLFVSGPDGAYYLSQIAAGQTATSPCVNAGDPASSMFVGTTRTDGIQDDGIIDMGYHYTIPSPPPPPGLWINLTANGSTIIPPGGGTLSYNIAGGNNGTTPLSADIWVDVTTPLGWIYGPVMGPIYNFTFAPGFSTNRDRNLYITGGAPVGFYILNAYMGDYNPPNSTIIVQDTLHFYKSGMAGGSGDLWFVDSGDPFPGEEPALNGAIPNSSFVIRNSPNPFNPVTTITYSIPVGGFVSLRVYDTTGRLVMTLVDGNRAAGAHEVTFDGSALPSGVYLYRLETGAYTSVGKMVLLK